MKLLSLLLSLAVIAMPVTAGAAVRHVPSEYTTIQAGIYASVDGDTILVASGTYPGHFKFYGRAILVTSEEGPAATILEPSVGDSSIAIFNNYEGPNSILSGFTFRGTAGAAAVYINVAGPTIADNVFINNHAYDGGGVSIHNGTTAVITGNEFAYNHATNNGGGLYSYGATVNIANNSFHHNVSDANGGAILLRAATNSYIHHNIFHNNQCRAVGGAICLSEDTDVRVYNNTIASNSDIVNDIGAGLAIAYSQDCNVYNNIIVNNEGKGIGSIFSPGSVAIYNDVWGNAVDYDHITPGIGSLSADPLFVGGGPFDYHLAPYSPCIDFGDPASPFDPDGSRADMGALYTSLVGLYGWIDGHVRDGVGAPIVGVVIYIPGRANRDTTGADGLFEFQPLAGNYSYDIIVAHPGYFDTAMTGVAVVPDDTTHLDIVLEAGIDPGHLRGIVRDFFGGLPLSSVVVEALPSGRADTTASDGTYFFGDLAPGFYDIRCTHPLYDTLTSSGCEITQVDTTVLNLAMYRAGGSCVYTPGDINGIGGANGIDVVYGIGFLKGANPPWVDCHPPCLIYTNPNPPYQQLPLADPFFAAMDVNGNCQANGIDITYFVAFLKGSVPGLLYCPDCPPAGR